MKTSNILNILIINLQTKLDSRDINNYTIVITFENYWTGIWDTNVSKHLNTYCKCYKITKLKL